MSERFYDVWLGLDESGREGLLERAAILEFMAGLPREQAEAEALRMWRNYVAQRQEQ